MAARNTKTMHLRGTAGLLRGLALGLCLGGPVSGLVAGPAWAQSEDREQAARYAGCMDLIEIDPDQALESAQTWADLGGGDPARHCAAVALLRLGHHAAAGQELETLAASLEPGFVFLQIPILIQAGQAWFLAEDLDRAHAIQTAALAREPNNVDLLVDRSMTAAAVGNFEDAVSDLSRAQANAPQRPDILVLRASAYRYLDQQARALADVERALTLDPGNAEGHLERGNLRRLAGDDAGARDDWVAAARLAPETQTAAAAQANIAKLDLKVE
ncbi:hypothetical protein HBA54_05000 [Pelagibius litoralis]|uniref:Tetratricopeptide repeat-containing protein n=1 Tax=Pelagibius litoralis TaxID=374515 RepID=A0A967C268_9PROT|nr:hypothetical protein [Pelagibius litoralis]NIA67943.1 hypothetical protein [Pelagibius litoralis]